MKDYGRFGSIGSGRCGNLCLMRPRHSRWANTIIRSELEWVQRRGRGFRLGVLRELTITSSAAALTQNLLRSRLKCGRRNEVNRQEPNTVIPESLPKPSFWRWIYTRRLNLECSGQSHLHRLEIVSGQHNSPFDKKASRGADASRAPGLLRSPKQ